MDNVFPSGVPGLDVQNVIYNYTIHKDVNDQVDVHVQNENALGTGYIFRETDRWMPGSLDGTQINKAVPVVPNIPREAWGDGSIQVDGNGSVSDARVVYTYKADPCYDPQYNPSCPGYVPPKIEVPEYEIYDATQGDANQEQYNPDDERYADDEELSDEEKEKQKAEEEQDSKERLEKALAAADNAALFAVALTQSQQLATINAAVNMNAYYAASLKDGKMYAPTQMPDAKLPESRKGLRNGLAQQILHEKMVDMQYNR